MAPPPARRVDANGRLVRPSFAHLEVSYRRLAAVVLIAAILVQTNPANHNTQEHLFYPYARVTTNFWFFSTIKLPNGVRLMALGRSFDCPVAASQAVGASAMVVETPPNPFSQFVCPVLRDILCHGRPLVWYPTNRAYTAHRILVWTYLLLATVCYVIRNLQSVLTSGQGIVSSFFSLLLPDSSSSVLGYTLSFLYVASTILHSTWERLDQLVLVQHANSFFRPTLNDDWNYLFAVCFFWIYTTLIVHFTKHVVPTGRQQQHGLLVAVALGYLRGSFGPAYGRGQGRSSVLLLPSWSVSTMSLTWTLILLLGTTTPSSNLVVTIVPWIAANTMGALLGDYQFQNQDLSQLANAVWKGLRNSFQSLFWM